MLFLLVMVVSLVFLFGSVLALLYVLSKTNRYGTRVETGGFKFLVKGESLYQVLDNLPEHEGLVDQDTYKVIPKDGPGRRRTIWILERWFGIIWISIFWPLKRVHHFKVVADKLKTDEEIRSEKVPVRQQLKTELRETDYLRYRFTHPVLITDIELGGDLWKVDLIAMLDVEVVNPATVVFVYKGQVLRPVDAAVISVAIDFWKNRGIDYRGFVETEKGATSDFAKRILALNEETAPGPQNDGLKDRFGIKIMAVWVQVADLSPEQKTLNDAAQAVDKERLLADARVEEARGLKALEKGPREGIAEGLKMITKELIAAGLPAEKTAEIVKEQVRMKGIEASKLTTYVEGGGNAQPTIPLN